MRRRGGAEVEIPGGEEYIPPVKVFILGWIRGVFLLLLIPLVLAGCDDGPFASQSLPGLDDDAELPPLSSLGIDDPGFIDGYQWYLETINAPLAWRVLRALEELGPLSPTVVAVIDTTYDLEHEDMSDVFAAGGFDFINESSTLLSPSDTSSDGHGSHVAGLIGARGGNGMGMVGLGYNIGLRRTVHILPLVMLDSTGEGDAEALRDSIFYASGRANASGTVLVDPVSVINMSLGSSGDGLGTYLQTAIDAAVAADIVIVAAAGNARNGDEPPGVLDFPARMPEVIGVGSIDADRVRSPFSFFSARTEEDKIPDGALDLVAPGGVKFFEDGSLGILSTIPRDRYGALQGTSMAAPLVAGAAALVRSANPYLTAPQVRQILRDTAVDLGEVGWDPEYGYGLIDVAAAVRRARSTSASVAPSAAAPVRTRVSPVHATWEVGGLSTVLLSLDAEELDRLGITDAPAHFSELTGVTFSESVPGFYLRGEVPVHLSGQDVLDRLNTARGVRQAIQNRVIQFR